MRKLSIVTVVGVLAIAGCGGDEEPSLTPPGTTADAPARAAQQSSRAASPDPATTREADGTRIVVAESEFGEMLFDAKQQAIYIFENDRADQTVCYDECARAWPPVFTDTKPVAGKGVDASPLGTVKRRDGRLQVTYAGKPLYFYAHEEPGEVRCHNVNLNGGLWWVVGPDGERRA
jgi:predicted lipoprotein with Yx(FWY)xxD motif